MLRMFLSRGVLLPVLEGRIKNDVTITMNSFVVLEWYSIQYDYILYQIHIQAFRLFSHHPQVYISI